MHVFLSGTHNSMDGVITNSRNTTSKNGWHETLIDSNLQIHGTLQARMVDMNLPLIYPHLCTGQAYTILPEQEDQNYEQNACSGICAQSKCFSSVKKDGPS